MKIINYNPEELEKWRIFQQDGELVREHTEVKQYQRAKNIAQWLLFLTAIVTLTASILSHDREQIGIWFTILICIDFVLLCSSLATLIAAHLLKPNQTYGYQPERTFREWFHARASKYKIIAVDRLNKTGNTRLEVAFEKEDGSVLKCISPYVTVIETTKRTEHTLDVSTGVLYIAYGADREPITFEDE